MRKIKLLFGLFILFTIFFAFATCSYATDITWNPNDKDSDVILSNNNLTVSRTNPSMTMVRSTTPITGKKYFEVTINNETYTEAVGISNSTAALNGLGDWPLDDMETYVDTTNNLIRCGKANTLATFPTANQGDIIMVAVDATNRKVYFGLNGVWANNMNPASTNGYSISWSGDIYAYGGGYESTDVITANFGATPFQYTVPSGYEAYNGSTTTIQAPTNLSATAGDAQINLAWTAVTGAISYKIKRATATGGPYTEIASGVTAAGYTDTGLTNGTTYYYVVTAVDANGESSNSNEASIAPTATSTSGQVHLVITMNNGADKEYTVTKSQFDAFVAWFAAKEAGSGTPYYIFDKPITSSYTSRKDYLVFSKIVCWEDGEY